MLTVAFVGYQAAACVRTAWTLPWWDGQDQLMEEKITTQTQPQHACRVKEAITQSCCRVFSSVSTIPLTIPLKTCSSFPSQSKVQLDVNSFTPISFFDCTVKWDWFVDLSIVCPCSTITCQSPRPKKFTGVFWEWVTFSRVWLWKSLFSFLCWLIRWRADKDNPVV